MIWKPKSKNQKGQEFIEYAVLLMVVMLGVVVMGPYVVKSWNAQVKGWEDSVMDSYYDPLADK